MDDPRTVSCAEAVQFGLAEAHVLNQIRVWNTLSHKAKMIDGHRWCFFSVARLKTFLPFISESTIKRCLRKLEALGVLLSRTGLTKGVRCRTKWYTVAEKVIQKLLGGQPSGQNDPNPLGQNEPNPSGHFEPNIKKGNIGKGQEKDSKLELAWSNPMSKESVLAAAAKVQEAHKQKPVKLKPLSMCQHWRHQCALKYSDMEALTPPTQKEVGQWSQIIKKLPKDTQPKEFLTALVAHWEHFAKEVQLKAGLYKVPTRPQVGYLLTHLSVALHWHHSTTEGSDVVQSGNDDPVKLIAQAGNGDSDEGNELSMAEALAYLGIEK